MARRTVTVSDLLGAKHRDHNEWLARVPSREADPAEAVIALDSGDDRAHVLLWGSAPWPLPGQSRAPHGPDPGDPPEGRPLPYSGPCVACGGRARRGHFCLACSMPLGSMVARARAAVVRLRRKEDARLAGGTGHRKRA
jgi:hypothetical protein